MSEAPLPPPVPPRREGAFRPQPTPPMTEFYRKRVEALENELGLERRRALEAQGLLRQQDTLRAEADRQLKTILEQLKHEKAQREAEEEKSKARGRIEALESRLDEMHAAWAGLLKDAVAKRDAGEGRIEAALSAALEQLRVLPETAARLEQGTREAVRLGEEERGSLEELRRQIDGLGSQWAERQAETERKLSLYIESHRGRIETLMRERAVLQQAMEEGGQRFQEAQAKDRQSIGSQLQRHSETLRNELALLRQGQAEALERSGELRALAESIHDDLNQPKTAKEESLQALERERKNLLDALKERTEQLRLYALERREVERSLAESLMASSRELEAERAKLQSSSLQDADLRARIRSLEGRLELSGKRAEENDARLKSLLEERDALARSLAEQARRAREEAAARSVEERDRERRIEEAGESARQERSRRLEAEHQLGELRAQAQTLNEHISKALQDKDKAEAQSSGWKHEREELTASLRKKEEMIALLSSTFQNLIKK